MTTLPANHVMQFPSGRWGFVGHVDTRLAFVQADGSAPTDKQLDTARHCGPGFAKLRKRTWDSRETALEAARDLGVEFTPTVQPPEPPADFDPRPNVREKTKQLFQG